jgi:outer membrane protein OmpA-like peptidoglycan-associated protein
MLREPEFELETELEQALEEEFETGLESEDEATELEPLFARRLETGQASTEEEGGQGLPCPTPQSITVSGFPRYSFSIASLPPNEQTKIRNIADLIAKSFQKGCQPLLRVRLTGHADRDLDRERRKPGFMMRVSRSRSAAVILELERLIKSRSISPWRIAWDRRGVGASSLVVQNPTTERERALNRRVVIDVSPSCTCTDFFEEYDRRFLPSDVNANPSMTPKERADRNADVSAMVAALVARRDARASAALQGSVPPSAPASSSLAPITRRLSTAQIELFRQCLPDGAGGISPAAFQHCFDAFANGELRLGHDGLREPNGGFYFLFAEFAFLCIDSNIGAAMWTSLLKVFVNTQEIFMHVYRPGSHPPPPPVKDPAPSPVCAQKRQLDDFTDQNFNAAGQSDPARKRALQAKYAPMDLNGLRQAAGENMRRAFCMQ